jgi:hypothetical protein
MSAFSATDICLFATDRMFFALTGATLSKFPKPVNT